MKTITRILIILLLVAAMMPLKAKEKPGANKTNAPTKRTSEDCAPSSSFSELDINNVRALLMNGGDMWWDLHDNPRYEIPKATNPADRRTSLFAGALWIGGLDNAGNMHIAAQTYRQNGNDFWPGPLTELGAVASPSSCDEWDRHFKINRTEIEAFRNAWYESQATGDPFNIDAFPNVKKWPGYGRDANGDDIALAPFVNVDNNPNDYNPAAGDYPDIRPFPDGGEPDQAVWWVINDKGGIHTESGGLEIGLEIHVMAFAFTTSNAINDMTFYRYRLFNKSTSDLNQTFLGQWVDADVGNPKDDYVGCDTVRGLGYCYNGGPVDGTASGYGANPPAVGTDFFQGPQISADSFLDMTRFVYYENDASLRGNPEVASHYYGYLRGFWKDGSAMTYGGNGYGGSVATRFMFPDAPSICSSGSGNWSESSVGNDPGDRRYMQAAGPFTLQIGSQMDIHIGVVWARKYENANLGSVCELFSADDVAQALFDSHFKLLDGPDAPVVSISEYDRELTISWDYPDAFSCNNYHESYTQTDPVLVSRNASDPEFEFQGYLIFQLKDGNVSASELFNTDRARVIAQCDLKDQVSIIVNRNETFVPGMNEPVITDQIMVEGENKGIFHSVNVSEDYFATGTDRRLVNYRDYYYAVIAYAWNDTASDGRRFLQGNRYFQNVSAMPHRIQFENMGTVTQSEYGDGIPVTQKLGTGNGGNFVEFTPETEAAILQYHHANELTFKGGAAPITVRVTDPKAIKASDYRLEIPPHLFNGQADTVSQTIAGITIDSTFVEWKLLENGQEVYTSTYIKRSGPGGDQYRPMPYAGTERAIAGHGFSIAIRNPETVWDLVSNSKDPIIGSGLTFADPSQPWLTGLQDDDDFERWNWILAGGDSTDMGMYKAQIRNAHIYDPGQFFETLLDGTWAPFCMTKTFSSGDIQLNIAPGIQIGLQARGYNIRPDSVLNLDQIPDVDIVITSDPSKWSKCVVVETGTAQNLGTGAPIMTAKWATGYNLDGSKDTRPLSEATQGWSYFPGYAIDLTTGRRLNIFFGENSFDRQNNGHDLLFNPGAGLGADGSTAGGRHFVYVSNTEYDGCARIQEVLSCQTYPATGTQILFNNDPNLSTHEVWGKIAWAGIPMATGTVPVTKASQIPSETRISLRINQPFRERQGMPGNLFVFSTRDFAAQRNQTDIAKKSLMEDVRIVPNPYYAHSDYEQSQIQTVAKLTNLPERCKIKIFTLNGTLVRTFNKLDDQPDVRWDLKNQYGVPVASGVYIIHVDGFELGETVVKFMTLMPQIDLSAF